MGRTGLNVSEVGFGCGNIGGLMIRGSHDEQIEAVGIALDLGINYFDTAPSYGNGISETNLGKVLSELNPKIVHICDGNLDTEKDEHLNLGEGDFDLKFIAELIRKNNIEKITFEVPKKDGLSNDLRNIECFKKIIEND